MSEPLRIGMLAGEMSGDSLGAGLIAAIKKRVPDAQFEGIGGPKMIAAGFHSLADQERLAVMGFVEPLKRLPELLAIRRRIYRHFVANPPAVFLGIDSPGFNITLEHRLRQAGIKTAHYVSPQIWAWRRERVHKIARSVDLMLSLFPFEARFYKEHNVPVSFVGHYLADRIPLVPDQRAARDALGLSPDQRVIALLPGSRSSEVKLIAPEFLATAEWCLRQKPDLHFIMPAANEARHAQLQELLKHKPDLPVTLTHGRSHEVMCAADAVLMASGTTTLEALLLKRPMVVAYKFPRLSYAIYSRLLEIPHISLPNILAGRELVPEYLQDRVDPEAMGRDLLSYLENADKVEALKQEFLSIHIQLQQNADERAADAVLALARASAPRTGVDP
ncbi:lipid-A-disaccharide synthase [Gilvimarinus sp. F26214L]|uniref:lipid-A-disaccharide synthase n=1 Tax=Gilvimarinus sp. DZF01 TaxID=3461371 RepID=UPI004045AC37